MSNIIQEANFLSKNKHDSKLIFTEIFQLEGTQGLQNILVSIFFHPTGAFIQAVGDLKGRFEEWYHFSRNETDETNTELALWFF